MQRRLGLTETMLHRAVQYHQETGEPVYVAGYCMAYAKDLCRRAREIAAESGHRIDVRPMSMQLSNREPPHGFTGKVFWDHYEGI